jgi:predicted glycosyltransferase
MRHWRPDIDFLVISGTSIPHIFFKEGIEVIKLPSIKLDIDAQDNPMSSRYLCGFDLEAIFDFRQRIISAAFDFFQPDVLMVEHNMTGQMSELIPLLMKKWMRRGGPVDFSLVHICRGIMKWVPLLKIPYQNPRHRSESINIGELYDFMYVLEDRNVIDINREFLGNDPELEKKIQYLGKITNKLYEELPPREEVVKKYGLTDKKIILVSLGRNQRVLDISVKLLEVFETSGVNRDYEIIMILDPYLECGAVESLKNHPLASRLRFMPFIPDLVDLISHSELVISRAGYNTMNEILLTGVKAIVIPESHGGGEQELRVRNIAEHNIMAMNENEVLGAELEQILLEFLGTERKLVSCKFDKYAIGKTILADLEDWKKNSKSCR